MSTHDFDVFGRRISIERAGGVWRAWHVGPEGKRRPAHDLVIPADTPEDELETYLADLCHEWASPEHPAVRRLG